MILISELIIKFHDDVRIKVTFYHNAFLSFAPFKSCSA